MNGDIICTYYEVICLGTEDGRSYYEIVLAKKKTRKEANDYVKRWEEAKKNIIIEGEWFGWHGRIYRDNKPTVRNVTIKESELKL